MKLHNLLIPLMVGLSLILSAPVQAWSPFETLERGFDRFQDCGWQVTTEAEGEKKKIPEEGEEEEEPDCE